ncbi:hypothetical protein PXO_05832 [Xanthomonas oryzae pv. oryzae PXO99A]|uniref:Uncharacterized protein n=1 Tax=Xanthomonas oryzae pv. oryzae (strain PXO99A) TaxID=360094 RepID=A0A0K0GL25_XANOP|nr:hypothetical protein PXO_05832 [Xanthomonas oryzae pv. oryzae PXO99A]
MCAQRASDAQSKAMSRSQIILHAHLPRACIDAAAGSA